MNSLKFSKFVHFFEMDNKTIAVYHSLLIKTLFFDKDEIEKIKNFLKTRNSKSDDVLKSIKYLFENYFLIEHDTDDSDLLKKYKGLIEDPNIANTYIVTTENCNFNCEYCFIKNAINANTTEKIMSRDVAKQTVSFLQKNYERQKDRSINRVITFYGGEPLLNFNAIKTVVEEINEIKKIKYWPEDQQFTIITNGSLLTEEIIDFMKVHNFSLGISFDGNEYTSHNRINKKNEPVFEQVVEKIKLCNNKKIPFTLSVTITNELIERQDEILDYILSFNPKFISFNMLIPNEIQKQSNNYYEQATDLMIKAFEKFREKGIYEDRVMRKVDAFVKRQIYLHDCSASGGNQYVISPNGDVGICHAYLYDKKYFPTNIYDTEFRPENNDTFKMWKNRTPILMDECLNCESLGICGGGCPYIAEYNKNSIFELDERFCIHSKRLLNWMITDLYNNMKEKV